MVDPRRGDLETLYRSDHARIVRLAFLLSGDRSFAEEAAQEAFVRLLASAADVREPAGYLTTITVNLCRDRGRRSAVARTHADDVPRVDQPADLPSGLDDVMQAIRRLPEASREVVVLRYWLDLPTRQIAHLVGRRPATVRSLLHRAHLKLAEELSDG